MHCRCRKRLLFNGRVFYEKHISSPEIFDLGELLFNNVLN
ncbi:hypothetical protein DesyoDRAFT_1622 [Desulfosporosinus youngiae DSM 17734]|uniref:Uncharacterized protein n=1 Tax=Desulfosporosinus youngiae DSM 17734 TaxID=768710 RepID=H5Y356_9FIRM|nr:hypothetical protein DesyoDRAFT_1622 [Desulfosporosinus youngiae DSM 17734]